jgi:dihydroorotate dehydrogenase electron transfer subunit
MSVADHGALVLANRRLANGYNVVSLAAPDLAAAVAPGQFIMLKVGPGLDPLLRRPFSVFERLRDPRGEPMGISLLNKAVGAGTRRVYELEAGDRVACLGPLGRPFEPVAPPVEAWLVAGGVGLAPFATLSEALSAAGTKTTLFYGARRAAELMCLELFEARGCTLVLATEDGSRGAAGPVTVPLEQALARTSAATPVALYACGPTGMLRAVAALARRYARPCVVSLEPTMGCGLGGCYSCVVPVADGRGGGHWVRACVEGPVFPADRIVWERM